MKRIFTGHRGVGKSSLLERHLNYFPDIPVFDLDQVIAENEAQQISEIFQARGEAQFRELETKYFQRLISEKSYVISVGAGFDVKHLPADAEVVYVSRRTDSDGRIFLNRPRLNPEVSALQESILRYQQRDPAFRDNASWIYHLPEGLSDTDDLEETLFKKTFSVAKAYYTLSRESEIQTLPHLNKFELRTDIFSVSDITRIIEKHRDKLFLVAIRSKITINEIKDLRVDWALENGPVPDNVNAQIVSLHDGELSHLNEYGKDRHLKFCPIVDTWEELIIGYRWQQANPQYRSFLPRARHGKSRWRWFRILMLSKQKINFVQGLKDLDDQPSLYEYLQNQNSNEKHFGAVLGDPIHHSRTPIIQALSMQDYGQILAIPLAEIDFQTAIPFLAELGLKFAAVTSPLKLKAAALVGGDNTEGVNTLFYANKKWLGTSTDADGLETMIEESGIENIHQLKMAIWGGVGVVSAIKKILPEATEFAARTGNLRTGVSDPKYNPDVVIWAAPRKLDVLFPPNDWKPKYIIDLNYVENSMALEYAQMKPEATYISGLDMFYAQAKEQFKFWTKHLAKED